MLDNHTYNLLKQIVQEHKALWRIKNHYKDDAGDCEQCNAFWDKAENEKEAFSQELLALAKEHLS